MNDIEKALPKLDPKLNRFWRVTLDKKSPSKPAKVALREKLIIGELVSETMSVEIGYARTIFNSESIGLAGAEVVRAVGSYLDMVGDY